MNGITQSDPSQNLWRTPKGDKELGKSGITLNILIKKFDLKLDPCASGPQDAMCKRFYTKKDNGLKQQWNENTIYNPPFSEQVVDAKGKPKFTIDKKTHAIKPVYKSIIGKWVEKGVQEAIKHKIVVVGILPVYTSLAWFQNYIVDVAEIKFIYGRIHYTAPDGKTGSPNFDSMICVWDARKK